MLALALVAALAGAPATAHLGIEAVTPDLVCAAKRAMSVGDAGGPCGTWSRQTVTRVAGALREAADPVLLLAICINESDLRERARAWAGKTKVDAGLCGVRCVLGDEGRCTNGVVRGKRLSDLYDPVVNVAAASQILASKGSASRYAGEVRKRGYADRVLVLAAALGGVRVASKSSRVCKLAERILKAVAGEPRS